MSIRQNVEEVVRTIIFRLIANKIRKYLERPTFTNSDASLIVKDNQLNSQERILNYVRRSSTPFSRLSRIVEMANSERDKTAAYYTRQDICYAIVSNLPDAKKFSSISIHLPSIGVGNFLPSII